MGRLWAVILFCGLTPGCVVVELGVTNPLDGVSSVAVAPFFNQSLERTADGRRFASAYFAELQKVPGFEVVPIGVTEQAIAEFGLQMDNPDDVLHLARLLNVDAVVVGAVTEYSPYYPPRIGLKVAWYSPCRHAFSPGVPTNPDAREFWKSAAPDEGGLLNRLGIPFTHACPEPNCTGATRRSSTVLRAQSPDAPPPPRLLSSAVLADVENDGAVPADFEHDESAQPVAIPPELVRSLDPRQPIMTYARLFDGTDAEDVAALRDYAELSGDQRSGDWEAALHRSEDFIRFTARLMIIEMLTLHGGNTRRRIVFTPRKYK